MVLKNSGSNLRRRSLYPQEMLLLHSASWPSVEESVKEEDDKESGSSDNWDDKIMLNKRDGIVSRDETPAECWDVDSEVFGPSCLPDPPATTYDYDEHLDAATSDSSETDLLWHLNPLNTAAISNGAAARKSQPKPVRREETR